jgi:S1-C subfamily serine protease
MRRADRSGTIGRMSDLSFVSVSNSLADAVARAERSVVQVQGRRRPASGIVYAPDLVVTTTRALGRDDGIRVRDAGGRLLDAELAGWDPATGIVLLRVKDLNGATLTPSDTPVRVGHLALAVARSWSNAVTATAGIVSVIGGPLPTGPGRSIERVIRTTAPMHAGFAGGALIDGGGRLIGLTTAAEIRGLGVVIPGDIVWRTAAALAEHGTLTRGHLGVSGQPVAVPERLRDQADRPRALLVVGVVPGSPADTAGILVGDLMIRFDDHPVESPVDLLELLQPDQIGRTVAVRVIRGGESRELTVTVGSGPVD